MSFRYDYEFSSVLSWVRTAVAPKIVDERATLAERVRSARDLLLPLRRKALNIPPDLSGLLEDFFSEFDRLGQDEADWLWKKLTSLLAEFEAIAADPSQKGLID